MVIDRLPFFFLLSQLFAFRFLSEPLVNGFWELADPDSVFGGRIFETSLEGLNETYILQFSCIGGGAEGGIQVAVFRSLQESIKAYLKILKIVLCAIQQNLAIYPSYV